MIECDGYNIIGDTHTRDDLLKAALSLPGKPLLIGDMVDGPGDEIETLKMAKDCFDTDDPNIILGNHEADRIQVVSAAMCIMEGKAPEEYTQIVDAWVKAPWMGRCALNNYDVSARRYKTSVDKVMQIYERMEKQGLFTFLLNLPAFIELPDTEKPTSKQNGTIAIHSGLTDENWPDQRRELNRFVRELRLGNVGQAPDQLYAFGPARSPAGFKSTDKTVVTGHVSLELTPEQRITADGRRVRLGSPIKHAGFNTLYTYNTAAKEVIPVQAD